jgi:Dolichyl-phosphate-mannose-protein mannosyltransferase
MGFSRAPAQPISSEMRSLVGLTLLGLLVRVVPVSSAQFPLLDGGLLYSMASDLGAHAFALPAFTSYNGGGIPFVYPPLGPYLLAGLHLTGIPLTDLIHWLPLAFATLCVPAVYLLAREFQSEGAALATGAAYALMPGAFQFLILGGGVTRAGGVLFAVLALRQAMVSLRTKSIPQAYVAGAAGGIAVLLHPQAGVFVAVVGVLLIASRVRSRGQLRLAVAVVLTTIIVISPWVFTVVAQHGFAPFLSAVQSRSPVLISLATVLFIDVTGAFFSVFLGFALIGLIAEIAARRFLLPGVFLAVILAIPTPAPVVGDVSLALIPLAMLIGVGVADIVLPAVFSRTGSHMRPRVVAAFLAAGLLASLGAAYAGETPFFSTTAEQREAMSWVADEVPTSATFVVMTGQIWPEDAINEWFPALTGRTSLGTPQGFEWTNQWASRVDTAVSLQRCAVGMTNCLTDWAKSFGGRPAYLFIAKGPVRKGPQASDDCCARLREDVRASMPIVYDGPGATVAMWTTTH